MVGARWLVAAGFPLVLAGAVPFSVGCTATNWLLLLTNLFVRGIGLGVVTVPLMTMGVRGHTRQDVPDASIISRIFQQVGGSFAVRSWP